MPHAVRGQDRNGLEPYYIPEAQVKESLCQKISRIFCCRCWCCFSEKRVQIQHMEVITTQQNTLASGFKEVEPGHFVLAPMRSALSEPPITHAVSLETFSSDEKETASTTEAETSESNPLPPLSPVSITDEGILFQFQASASTLDLLRDEAAF